MFLDCLGGTEWLNACGNLGICIPADLAYYTKIVYNAIRVATPLILILIGMFDLAKAVTSKSEDEIKKAQQLLVKKAIAGAIVFFLFSLIAWMITILGNTSGDESEKANNQNIINCLNELFVEGKNADNIYTGIDEGYTDGGALCRNYGYDGITRIVDSDNTWVYECYKDATNDPGYPHDNCRNARKIKTQSSIYLCVTCSNQGFCQLNPTVHGTNTYYGSQFRCNYTGCNYSSSRDNCQSKCNEVRGSGGIGEIIIQNGKKACLCISRNG